MQFKLTIKTLCWILVFLAISYFIGKITLQNMEWYQTLTKSPLTPPRIVFPIVWNLLYIMLASAGSLLWARNDQKSGKKHLVFFCCLYVYELVVEPCFLCQTYGHNRIYLDYNLRLFTTFYYHQSLA